MSARERAKGLLIELKGFTEQEAYKYIQDISMNKCKPIQHVAKYIINELERKKTRKVK